jgi:vanillate monooxygenase ferredoxin subunit
VTEVEVTHIHRETANVRRITLAAADGTPLPAFQPGAHIDVHLPNGLVRQYSLTGSTGQYEIGVLRDSQSRGGSQWLHDSLRQGDRLVIGPPRNLFSLSENATRHILFAGGIGITPLLSMARHLASDGADFEIHYSVSHGTGVAFSADVAELVPTERLRVMTRGRQAAQDDWQRILATPSPGTHLYVCGPAGYIQALLDLARRKGWPDDQVHTESFGAAPPAAGDKAFTVRLAQSGRTVPVRADQTVVQALEAHGIQVPVSCQQGICGTCLTGVLSGLPDHRDQYLTEDEQQANDQFTPCCSRSLTPELVLRL